MSFEDLDKLLKFKFGREEYCRHPIVAIVRIPKTKSANRQPP